jgi:outer membrane protein assembly factor BamB
VIPKTTGAQQAVFDPAPQIKGSTTRPVDAVVQIKTPAGLLTPVKVDDTVYFAAKDGTFFGIKGDSLELVEKKKLGQTVARLTREGKQLKADVQPNPMTVLEFPDPIDAIDPEDVEQSVEMSSVDGKPVPFAWTQHGSAEKQVVFYQGKYFRPLIGGKTKMLDGGKVTTHQGTPVSGIVMWKIAILPSGPMGYDNTSVYELNEHLRPTNRIINLDEVGRWTSVRVNSSLAGDGKTICFVSAYNNKARIMVWSLDGKQKLREMPVTYNETATTEGRRLVAVGDGYLFCGGELTFLPSGEGAFGQYLVKGAGDLSAAAQMVGTRRGGFAPAPAANKKVQNFTPPVVIGNKLFVGNAAGNVYVFDTSSFSANPGSTGNAAVSP